MHEAVESHLLNLNREFYQSFALAFSRKRSRLQPGVLRALQGLPPHVRVLELGCGDGQLASHLAAGDHRGGYIGVDSSEALLSIARQRELPPGMRFVQADLSERRWTASLGAPADATPEQLGELPQADQPRPAGRFDRIYAFAVLHHIPGSQRRARLAAQLRSLLNEDGRAAISVWNFLASPRLRQRILPWSEIGLDQDQLEPGDYLLDWREGGRGLRYVHHFTEPELEALAAGAGLQTVESYLSDGEGGRLGRYQLWAPL